MKERTEETQKNERGMNEGRNKKGKYWEKSKQERITTGMEKHKRKRK
jgi:hypothetical protein